MKLVPAGTSKKTGKAYKAFYSCGQCKATLNADIAPNVQPGGYQAPTAVWADRKSPGEGKALPTSQGRESNEAYSRRLAVHGFVNGLFAGGKDLEAVEEMLPALVELEDKINAELDKSKAQEAIDDAIADSSEPVLEEIPF